MAHNESHRKSGVDMTESPADENSSVLQLECAACHNNTIYVKVINPESNRQPFNSTDYTCTECNQHLNKDHLVGTIESH